MQERQQVELSREDTAIMLELIDLLSKITDKMNEIMATSLGRVPRPVKLISFVGPPCCGEEGQVRFMDEIDGICFMQIDGQCHCTEPPYVRSC